jgi:hypothetical protein
MGVFVAGEPLGEKVIITEKGAFINVGASAIYIRTTGRGPDCERIAQDDRVLVPIVPLTTFP